MWEKKILSKHNLVNCSRSRSQFRLDISHSIYELNNIRQLFSRFHHSNQIYLDRYGRIRPHKKWTSALKKATSRQAVICHRKIPRFLRHSAAVRDPRPGFPTKNSVKKLTRKQPSAMSAENRTKSLVNLSNFEISYVKVNWSIWRRNLNNFHQPISQILRFRIFHRFSHKKANDSQKKLSKNWGDG